MQSNDPQTNPDHIEEYRTRGSSIISSMASSVTHSESRVAEEDNELASQHDWTHEHIVCTPENRANTPDIFDDVLFLETRYLDRGRTEGCIAGLEKGRQDGENMGHTYGTNYGEEIGFYLGFVDSWLQLTYSELLVSSQLEDSRDTDGSDASSSITSIPPLPVPADLAPFHTHIASLPPRPRRTLLLLASLRARLPLVSVDSADEEAMNRVETLRARFKGLASRLGLSETLGLSKQDVLGF
jgi:hypothetical protein